MKWNVSTINIEIKYKNRLTAARRQVFSLRAPTHPVNPITNVTKPTNQEKHNQFQSRTTV